MKSYVDTILLPGESLEYAGQLHWIIFVPGLFCSMLGGFLCLSPETINRVLGIALGGEIRNYLLMVGVVVVFGGILMLTHSYLRLISTELAVTNRRVICKTGFISRNTFEVMLNRIEGANIDQTVWGRLLGFGSIWVHGTGGGVTPIDFIADPISFKKMLMTWVQKNQPGGLAAPSGA
jgi:uncharacterized membrane protein YdbT with pleckstrin-like domain